MKVRRVPQNLINAGVLAALCIGYTTGFISNAYSVPAWVPVMLWIVTVAMCMKLIFVCHD